MPDVLLLLLTALAGLIFSYLVVTVFNVGGSQDEALNRDLEQIIMQIGVQATTAFFLPLKGIWSISTDMGTTVASNVKWIVVFVLFTTATLMMHSYHYEILSIIDDGWTCAIVPIMRNIITPMLQIQRVVYALYAPFANAFLIVTAQFFKAWLAVFAQCSHINVFRIFSELTRAVITGTGSLISFFGAGDKDPESNFYSNDFEIDRPINHTLTAVSVAQDALACACNRFEPLFGIAFAVFREEHITACLDNAFQVLIRAAQMIFRILFKEVPDIYRVTFKLERSIVEGGLALDSLTFKTMENVIKMFSPDFELRKKPSEGPFTIGAEAIGGVLHTISTIGVNGPMAILSSTFDPEVTPFDPKVWSMEDSLSYAHRSIYSTSVFIQWLVYVMEKLVTDTFSIGDVFTSDEVPLELNCDWARDVEEHKYVSVGYTAGCSFYNLGIVYVNAWVIAYGVSVELLTKSIFTQEQNIFRTLQRWEGPHIARNKVYTCEERTSMSAFDYKSDTYYKEGHLWTQDRSKCVCSRVYGSTLDEGVPTYNPWCGQPNLNFDVFAPMDALVMHVSHGILGPGFGDAFPYVNPLNGIDIDIQVGSKEIKKSIKFPFPLPPLTRTAIESLRVMTRVVLSFGDIVTGHFFNYPVNCGHGMNKLQLEARWNAENPKDPAEGKTDELLRWKTCKSKEYDSLIRRGKRTPVCDKNNDSPDCMCSYLQPLTAQSKCKCISRYPDIDVTSSSQQVGDLIEKRFTSAEVSIHWCNSMIIEWTFQNTAAFADALDYMVSLGPINPTCDVMDRLIENKALNSNELDQRSKSAYLIANTPTLRFTGEFMDADTKINHIKDLYSDTSRGCSIKPGEMVNATDSYGNIVYQTDSEGNPTQNAVKVMVEAEWSCDASDSFVSIAELDPIDPEEKPGCRIWGRNDFFCSAGLYVRNTKRLSMNIARQVVNDGIAVLSGNFADVNLGTLPRMCDYERQQGAIAAMIAGIIPRISLEMKKAFAKYINMILQIVFVQSTRTMLVLTNMATTIVQDFVSGTISRENIETTFTTGVDTVVDGYLWAVRYFFDTTGEFLDAVSPGAGSICDSIVDIIDMLAEQIKNELMDLVALGMKVFFNALAALTGDTNAIGPFFENAFALWFKIQTLVIRKVWDILNKIYDFFGPIGTFMKILSYGVCNAINAVMGVIDGIASIVTFGAGIGWEPMECVAPKLRGVHGNHTSGMLGKHFLRSSDNENLPRRIAEALDWNGTSVCDHFMSAAADYSYTDLRPLERAKWLECLEYKLIGVEMAKFLEAPNFPTDIVYNWKRKYVMAYDMVRAGKILTQEYTSSGSLDWAHARMIMYDEGLDADLYIRLAQGALTTGSSIIHNVEVTNLAEFILENIDPDYKNPENPGTAAIAWKTLDNAKDMYQKGSKEWQTKDMSKQMWTAVDASYEAHTHLQNWWSSLGTDVPASQTHTERVFANFKHNLRRGWQENTKRTSKHNLKTPLRAPIITGIRSCSERGDPGWCTDCNILDNLLESIVGQGEALARFYGTRFPDVIHNVSDYFDELGDYNEDFFDETFGRLGNQQTKVKVPQNSIRWTQYVKNDWQMFFTDFGTYMTNSSHKEIWLTQIDNLLGASRTFVQSTTTDYVPFYGYSFYHMYNWLLFSKCDLEATIYVTTTEQEERLQNMDYAIILCIIITLAIVLWGTWSVIPLFWLANTAIITAIISFVYLFMVYGYFLNCAPAIPYTLVEDINAWYHSRMEPGCFYKALPFIAVNASEDTCLSCSTRQEYVNCGNYTIVNYEDGMLPLHEFIDEYYITWPFLFWIRWKWPSAAVFAVKNGIFEFESVLGRLSMGAWQEEPIDPIWIDCYNAMWLDNILAGLLAGIAGYFAVKMTIIVIQTMIQMVILIIYTYKALNYMSLAVEKSVSNN